MAMAPPQPDKVQIPRHDASGRVTSIASFEGASASKLLSWDAYIRQEVRSALKGTITPAYLKEVLDGVGDIIDKRFRALDARLTLLEGKIAEVPKFVGTWRSGVNYHPQNLVRHKGAVWIARVASRDIAPGTSPDHFELAAKGTER